MFYVKAAGMLSRRGETKILEVDKAEEIAELIAEGWEVKLKTDKYVILKNCLYG